MLEEIFKQAKEQLSAAIAHQHGLAQDKAETAADIVCNTAVDATKQDMEKKDFTALKEMVSGTNTNSDAPAIKNLTPLVQEALIKNGFDSMQANNITSSALVMLFNMFNDKAAEAKSKGIDIAAMIEKLAGGGFGSMSALMGMAGGFMKGGGQGMLGNLMGKFKK